MSRKQEPRKPSPPPLSQRERGTIALSPCGGELERGLAGMRPAAIAVECLSLHGVRNRSRMVMEVPYGH